MALQTKTFTWGSFAYQSASNSYVIELTLTENSTDTANNTSSVGYVLKLKSGSQNRFTGDIKATLSLAGTAVGTKTNHITAAYNSAWTLMSGSATVKHNTDGSLTMPIQVAIETYNSYAPPTGSFGWSWALTTIPRSSAITSAANVTLGNACSVKWTPNSAAFRYKLKFSLGSWTKTTDPIHPNKTTAYTYTGCTLPLEVANQLPSAKTGTMTAVLTTYSDSGCAKSVGTSTKTFTVTVPDNSSTKPGVSLSLSPDSTPFSGLYIQGLSRVKATVTATGKYGTAIKKKTFTVNGSTYEGSLSDYLTTAKALTVTAQATDARGITGTATKSITVLPYSKPKLEGVKAYRCNAAGEQDDSGQYLNIQATRSYAPVLSNGVQKNFCRIQYRYKQENGSYSDYTTILADTASGNSVVTGALLEGALQRTLPYVVQIRAIDTVGNAAVVTQHIPSESIFCHKPPGGRSLGLGGYAQEDNRLEVWWDQHNRGDLTVDGTLTLAGTPLLDLVYPVGSIYMSVSATNPATLFGGTWERLQDRFLLAAGNTYAPGSTGGEASHTLTASEMPKHSHAEQLRASGYSDWSSYTTPGYGVLFDYDNQNGSAQYCAPKTTANTAVVSAFTSTTDTGGSAAHNNMPPYLAVYMYKRTA